MRYWARKDTTGKTTTVESYTHDLDIKEAIEITKAEYDAYIALLPSPIVKPVRDLAAEIDQLKARIEKLGI